MNKKNNHFAQELYRTYRQGYWLVLHWYLKTFPFQRVYAELFGELVDKDVKEPLKWDLAEQLLTSGLKPSLLRKVGALVVVIAMEDMSLEEDPTRIFDLIERWQPNLNLPRLDLRLFAPADVREEIFRLMVRWIGMGARAKLEEWALTAVWKRLPDSVAVLEPILQRRPRSRARFKKMLAGLTSEDIQWYERLISDLQQARRSLNTPEPEAQGSEIEVEVKVDLV